MYRLIGADGVTRWVLDRAACRPRGDGTFEVSGIVSDVTERRRLEDDLQRSMRQMQHAHRELERARADAEQRASHGRADGAPTTGAGSPNWPASSWTPTSAAAACCCSTPITSSRSTTPTATRSAMRC